MNDTDTDTDLDQRLAALRTATATATPPATTDHAVAAAIAVARRPAAASGNVVTIASRRADAGGNAFTAANAPRHASSAPHRPGTAGERWLAWPLALAATIAVLSFVVRSVPPSAVMPEPTAVVSDADAFLPVVPLADIARAGDTLVVPARVPRTMLAALGLPIDPARAADAIDAELLVRADGSVLAVRFVY